MPITFTSEILNGTLTRLREANESFAGHYPDDAGRRQPVHTVYGGAQIFKYDTASRLGTHALSLLSENASDFVTFARALQFPGHDHLPRTQPRIKELTRRLHKKPESLRTTDPHAWLAFTIFTRVLAKLQGEPIEDFRIDFEDGYGHRPDHEEDGHALFTAGQMVLGMKQGTLPPFIGIRVKPLTEESRARSVRTLDLFLTTLAQSTGGQLPDNFVVTLPKVTLPEQVAAMVELFEMLETRTSIPRNSLRLEIMVETPQAILNAQGMSTLPQLVAAAQGRLVAAHFGVYDYTALCEITAMHQSMTHPAADFARHMMKVAFAQTGIALVDGATTVMPIPPHRVEKGGRRLTARERADNRETVHAAWRISFDDITHSLRQGFYQGWDLHPGQLPVRYAAVYAFFLSGLDQATARLHSFMEKAAQATVLGNAFDDAATGQGLLNFFLRGMNCGAITEAEAARTGLSTQELQLRSFARILAQRKNTSSAIHP
jgi:citrate lyase beta subunit